MIRRRLLLVLLLALAGCANRLPKPELPEREQARTRPPSGELYAPHLKDGGPPVPPDIARIPEPIPVPEPRSRYGNRSPYSVLGRSYHVRDSARGYVERGLASWYGNKFHGRPTSSFEPYDMYKFTAAHKTLPLPSFVEVTNLENGRQVVVRVNDRGPFHDGRIIDLSYAAAVRLGIHVQGVGQVEVRALDPAGARLAERPLRAGERALHRSAIAAPAPLRGPVGSGRRLLQVASFAVKDNAERLRDRLREDGQEAVELERAAVGGRTVWRVRIGPLAAAELAAAERRLERLGIRGAQTVAP